MCVSSQFREMKLTEASISSLAVSKSFTENQARINSLDFSDDGLHMISSSDDDSVVMYDCQTGQKSRSVNSKKYGVDLIQFAHLTTSAIHCSTKVDDVIRYLSLHDNKYIRYFPGHTKKVVTLCMSPLDDMFLSGSLDKTVRLWDLRQQSCQGLMHVPSRPVAAFDPEGLIFAVGINSKTVKLYDLRSFDKGPFVNFEVPAENSSAEWAGLRFSPDGRQILITTNGTALKILDSYSGNLLHTLQGHENSQNKELDATYTPDSQFVLSGSTNGQIHIWSARTGQSVARLASDHSPSLQKILFNPRFFMLATACTTLNLWIPIPKEDATHSFL
ncbi:hypothetical protein AB6A40_003452 [Gnathostoma spinigerum]|uniref:WD repeat-containing protein 82 n=1 Tax=Gnathostoma spinigerum TaxID=75299 RepID=A0ABD6E9S4_9BILA